MFQFRYLLHFFILLGLIFGPLTMVNSTRIYTGFKGKVTLVSDKSTDSKVPSKVINIVQVSPMEEEVEAHSFTLENKMQLTLKFQFCGNNFDPIKGKTSDYFSEIFAPPDFVS